MRPNPLNDALDFMTQPAWPVGLLWLLLIGSVVLAFRAIRLSYPQPTLTDIGTWVLRVLVGCMWWQQSMWKVPPDYDGLLHWMGEMVDHAAILPIGMTVRDLVIPDIAVFGPLVYLVEVAVAVSLILGVASRWGALIGLLMAGTLWLGLYSAPVEWPWTYVFLVVIQASWVLQPPGHSLGADALVMSRRVRNAPPAVAEEDW